MIEPQPFEATPSDAAALIHEELDGAVGAIAAKRFDAAVDSYVRALGLALQLGPAPTELVLAAVLEAAGDLAHLQEALFLSALGPALVNLVTRARQAGAIARTPVMEAWAMVAEDLGTLLGQVGLATELPAERRGGMMHNARVRAVLLDDATNGLFALSRWIDEIHPAPR
jgi:hypothetical protein